MVLEEILGSRGKARVLKFMIEHKEATVSEVSSKTGMSYRFAVKHLDNLVKNGVLLRVNSGNRKIYKLNMANPRTKLLYRLIRELIM